MTKATHDFETSFKRLEEVVRKLEGGDLPLASALELFEEGVKLSRVCHARLDEAERKVEVLLKKEDGASSIANFEEP